MIIRSILLTAALAGSIPAIALNREVVVVTDQEFESMKPGALDGNKLYSTSNDLVPFTEWVKSPLAQEFLVLYPDYKERIITLKTNGRQMVESLDMFVSKAKTIINRPAATIDLKKMLNVNFAASLDPEIKHKAISPSAIMPILAGKDVSEKFDWCNTPVMKPDGTRDSSKDSFFRYRSDGDLSQLQRPGPKWCENASRSICLESCYAFTHPLWTYSIKLHNKIARSDDMKDNGISFESELRYYVSEAEMGKRIALKDLTKFDGKVTGVIEQNMFYFDQVFDYGKVLAVFQELPDNRTLVTSFVIMGVRHRTLAKNSAVKATIMGHNPVYNTKTGLTAGLPIFTRDLAKQISAGLDLQ